MWHNGNEGPPTECQLQEARDFCLLCSCAVSAVPRAVPGAERVPRHCLLSEGLSWWHRVRRITENSQLCMCKLCDFRQVT